MSFVTEPPLGPRPDLIEDDQDDQDEIEEEYDESRCEVNSVSDTTLYSGPNFPPLYYIGTLLYF